MKLWSERHVFTTSETWGPKGRRVINHISHLDSLIYHFDLSLAVCVCGDESSSLVLYVLEGLNLDPPTPAVYRSTLCGSMIAYKGREAKWCTDVNSPHVLGDPSRLMGVFQRTATDLQRSRGVSARCGAPINGKLGGIMRQCGADVWRITPGSNKARKYSQILMPRRGNSRWRSEMSPDRRPSF